MNAALTIPDPARSTLAAMVDACLEAREWADNCNDIDAAVEALGRVAAIEAYLAKRGQDAPAQEAARWLEVRIGELLGPAEMGRPQSSVMTELHYQARHEFRQMAANRDLVAGLVPCSRRAILNRILQLREVPEPLSADASAVATFPTIVIDPPWRYGNTSTRGAAEDHYPTMSMDELADLKLPAAADAHLYLWVTNSFMREGFDLIDAWGFTYKTVLTWCKPSIGMGNYFRNNTEHVLFAVRGKLPTNVNNVGTWFAAGKTKHSAKPQSFYDLVEKASPGPYMEMFARSRRLGDWTVWGNEA